MSKSETALGVLAVCLCWPAASSVVRAEAAAVDSVHSSVLFRIKHLDTSYAWGRFNEVSGKVNFEDRNPSLDVQIKTESVDTGNAKRDQHLKSPDFFSSKQFPTIAFKSTKVKKVGPTTYEVDGTLTLHGVSKPVQVKVEQTGAGKNQQGVSIVGYEALFDIKRSDFGMKFLLEGLADQVFLIVSLETAQQP